MPSKAPIGDNNKDKEGKDDECGQKDNDKENNPFVKFVQVILFEELPDLIIQNLDL